MGRSRLGAWASVHMMVAALACLVADGSDARSLRMPKSADSLAARDAPAVPIPAWSDLCRRHPAECRIDPNEPNRIVVTPYVWNLIDGVNRRVNASIMAKTDEEHWGVEDRWDFAEDGIGDCEDFQLVKRRELARLGLPRRAMRMTVVLDELGQGHAVLTIATDRGDLVLDNKRNDVVPWRRTGYVFLKREGDAGPAWVSLGGEWAATAWTAGR